MQEKVAQQANLEIRGQHRFPGKGTALAAEGTAGHDRAIRPNDGAGGRRRLFPRALLQETRLRQGRRALHHRLRESFPARYRGRPARPSRARSSLSACASCPRRSFLITRSARLARAIRRRRRCCLSFRAISRKGPISCSASIFRKDSSTRWSSRRIYRYVQPDLVETRITIHEGQQVFLRQHQFRRPDDLRRRSVARADARSAPAALHRGAAGGYSAAVAVLLQNARLLRGESGGGRRSDAGRLAERCRSGSSVEPGPVYYFDGITVSGTRKLRPSYLVNRFKKFQRPALQPGGAGPRRSAS